MNNVQPSYHRHYVFISGWLIRGCTQEVTDEQRVPSSPQWLVGMC